MNQLDYMLYVNRNGSKFIQTWEMESELLVEPDSEEGVDAIR